MIRRRPDLLAIVAMAGLFVACSPTRAVPPPSSGAAPSAIPTTATSSNEPNSPATSLLVTVGPSTSKSASVGSVPQGPEIFQVPLDIPLETEPRGSKATQLKYFFHMLPDGRLVENPECVDPVLGGCGAVYLVDEAAGSRQELRGPNDLGEPFAHYFGSDDHHVVWSSDPAQELTFTNWEIWAASTDRAEPARRIASAANGPEGEPLGTGFIIPRVSGGIVVWSALTVATPGAQPTVNTLMAPADGSKPAEVVEVNAALPDISWPFVFVQKIDAAGQPSQNVRIDLRNGSREALNELPPCYVRTGGGKIVCLTKDDLDLYVADLDGHPLLRIKRNAKRPIAWPEISDGAVVWDDEVGPVLMTLSDLRIRHLAITPSSVTVGIKGSRVWWAWVPDPSQPPSNRNTARSILNLTAPG
jgi:hypothetical protein